MKASRKNSQGRTALALILAGGAAFGFWQYLSTRPVQSPERKILFYQDSMHPWIKSDQPGKCTICLMDLTPIHQGEQGFAEGKDTVVLSSNSITVMNVQTEEVRKRSLQRLLRVAGNLEADSTRKTILAAPAPGRIDNVRIASPGVDVKHGQVLATFYSPELTFQTRRYIFRDRITEMSQSGPMNLAGTPAASSRHAPTFGSSKTQPIPATERADADPFYNDLLATLAGTVVERNVFDGQYVTEGDRLFTIVDLSVLWFRFDVYEQQLAWLEVGQKIAISVPSLPGKEFPAVISVIEPALNEATRTIKVRADVTNPLVGPEGAQRRLLRLGMYAEGFLRAEIPDVLTVPRTAVLFPGGHAYAYVDKGGGAFAMRKVQLGRQGDEHWEILKGLEEGERVVTSGNVLIDAQAQFNHGTGGEEPEVPVAADCPACHETPGPGTAEDRLHTSCSDSQRKAAADFLALADRISSALADDNLERVREPSGLLRTATANLVREFGEHPLGAAAKAVHEHSAWGAVADLAAARKAFLPFSSAAVEFVQGLRSTDKTFASSKVFHCPMAPKPGLWYQAKGPLRNPYFGARMLSCGEEVRPGAALPETVQTMTISPGKPPSSASIAEHATPTPAAPKAVGPSTSSTAPPLKRDPGSDDSAQHSDAMGQPAPQAPSAAKGGLIIPSKPSFTARASAATGNATAGTEGKGGAKAPSQTTQETLQRFVAAVDGISQALAADDLPRYHKEVAALPAALSAMQKAYPAPHRCNVLLQRLGLINEGSPPKTLEMARKRFLLFSTNASELVRQLRKESPALAEVKIYKCSMAPPPGIWVQAKPPLRNPYFGAAMLTCGEEAPL